MYLKKVNDITQEYKGDISFEARYLDPGMVSYLYSPEKIDEHLQDIIFIAKPNDKIIKRIGKNYIEVYGLNETEGKYINAILELGHISWHREWGQEITSVFIKDDNSMNYYLMNELESVAGIDNNLAYKIAKKMNLESVNQIEITKMFTNKKIDIDTKKLKNEILEVIFKAEFSELISTELIHNISKELKRENGQNVRPNLFKRLLTFK